MKQIIKDNPRRVCVAPMIDCTDQYFRQMIRQISKHVYLYTEMITSHAILNGDHHRLLSFKNIEQPVALQLGGSCPNDLAKVAKIGEDYGYAEINLNIDHFEEAVNASIDAGAELIVCGAGFSKGVFKIGKERNVPIFPIVSSVKAAKLSERLGATAVVVEGGNAGGHQKSVALLNRSESTTTMLPHPRETDGTGNRTDDD